MPSPSGEIQMSRRSFLHTNVLLAFGIATTAKTLHATLQRRAIPDASTPLEAEAPYAEADINKIILSLKTHNDVASFLQQHATHHMPENAGEAMATFRPTPAEFQANGWKGPCSAFAEFAATCHAAQGRTPYINTFSPLPLTPEEEMCFAEQYSSASTEDEQRDAEDAWRRRMSWHVITSLRRYSPIKTGQTELIIHDNKSMTVWDRTMEEYAESHKMTMVLQSRWRPTDRLMGHLLYQLIDHESEQQISECPDVMPEHSNRSILTV